ncbi:MAG: hypothetical protein KIT73_05895 [Burkholderiales bacterium]|nr:hypothetical protein [Burkholderiales bacterium]
MSGLFLLIVLALLGVFIVAIFGMQQTTQALDVDGTRAHAAARAGIEWGLMQVLDPDSNDPGLAVAGNPQPPTCFGATAVPLGAEFGSVGLTVACARTATTEVNRNVAVYLLTATAQSGIGTAFPVERVVTATVSRCTDPNGAAPRFACP